MSHVIIIAEAGVNHNGDIEAAKELIEVAAKSGADYVKFQSFKASKLVSKNAQKADYQKKNTEGESEDQLTMLKKLELSDDDHKVLIEHCRVKEIEFLSTAFDLEGLDYLDQLGLEIFKIPSGEITNYPYLKKVASLGKKVIMSTGMANLDEIQKALEVLTSEKLKLEDIIVLHCNTEYPTPMEDVNLKAMNYISNKCGVEVGYSDHTLGIEVPIAAVTLGARLIEKHFTLDRSLPGPDHRASLEPQELRHMVSAIRNIESALSGSAIKEPSQSEIKNKVIARRSIHLSGNVKKGAILEEQNLICLRPGDGISPMQWNDVLGKKTIQDLGMYHKISWKDLL